MDCLSYFLSLLVLFLLKYGLFLGWFRSGICLPARYYYILINPFLLKKKERKKHFSYSRLNAKPFWLPLTHLQLQSGSANPGASHPSCSMFYIYHTEISYKECHPFNYTKVPAMGGT